MENFITGYTGHEHQLRSALKGVLGQEKYEYFFDEVRGLDISKYLNPIESYPKEDASAIDCSFSFWNTFSARKMPNSWLHLG